MKVKLMTLMIISISIISALLPLFNAEDDIPKVGKIEYSCSERL